VSTSCRSRRPYESDAWEQPIRQFLNGLVEKRTTLLDVATRSTLDIKADRLGAADQKRIGACLTTLGWESKRDMKGRWWVPATAR
jgi:hypothetical protein